MQIQKKAAVLLAVGLVAAGCSKTNGTAKNAGIQPTPLTADAASQVLTGSVAPQGWVPFEAEGGYVFFMPLSWSAQEAPGSQGHVLIGNAADLTAPKSGATLLDISLQTLGANASVSAAVANLGSGKTGVTKVVEGVTTSGLKTAVVSFAESRGTVAVYGVQKSPTEFILIKVSGNTQDPFVDQIVRSMAVRS